jgi:hypothetical protein
VAGVRLAPVQGGSAMMAVYVQLAKKPSGMEVAMS